jgi:hypothetical protein
VTIIILFKKLNHPPYCSQIFSKPKIGRKIIPTDDEEGIERNKKKTTYFLYFIIYNFCKSFQNYHKSQSSNFQILSLFCDRSMYKNVTSNFDFYCREILKILSSSFLLLVASLCFFLFFLRFLIILEALFADSYFCLKQQTDQFLNGIHIPSLTSCNSRRPFLGHLLREKCFSVDKSFAFEAGLHHLRSRHWWIFGRVPDTCVLYYFFVYFFINYYFLYFMYFCTFLLFNNFLFSNDIIYSRNKK